MDIQININRYSDSCEERPSTMDKVRCVMRGGDQRFVIAQAYRAGGLLGPLVPSTECTRSSFQKERAGVADPLFARRSAVP
jgi:hypothetical protein